MASKRTVPKPIQMLLKLDGSLTNTFCTLVSQFVKLEKHKYLFKGLEISCHGLPWLAAWLAFIWIRWDKSIFQMQINFFIGLVLDILCVAFTKAIFRRRRPPGNKPDMFLARGPDLYSFPSGHVSRAFFVAFFFTYLYPMGELFSGVLYAWAAAVSLSRILLKRHYILDVVAGFFLAIVEFYVLSFLWLSESTSDWIIEYISDEKIEGSEYHV